jgi:hypothetical protein
MRQERSRASPSGTILPCPRLPSCQEGNQCTSLAALHESVRVKGFGCRPVATARQAPGPASESLQGRNPRVVGHAGAASAMGICRSRTGCSIEASGGVRSRLGWRWAEAAAPSCIGLCDRPATEALSTAERVVASKRGRSRPMTGASDARYDGRCRVARS